jgi:hypothetical protein
MWEQQYRKTFVGMQATIVLITAAAYFLMFRSWSAAATFFVSMQVASIAGAFVAARIKQRAR